MLPAPMATSILLDCANYAETNPDIAGVGVRVSFYLQAFFIVLLVDRSWEDAPVALWTFIVTSFGILLAAIIQRSQLSIFQALQLSNLIWLANFSIFFSLASYSRQRAEAAENIQQSRSLSSDFKVKYGAMLQTIFSMALTLYIWANAPTFGNQPECSPYIKFMLFALEVPALGAGRIIGLTFTGLLTAIYLRVSMHDIQSYRTRMHRLRQSSLSDNKSTIGQPGGNSDKFPTATVTERLNDVEHTAVSNGTIIARSTCGAGPRSPDPPTLSAQSPQLVRRPKRRRWSFDLDPMFVGIIICQIMVFTYFIVSSELFLKRNPTTSNGASQWSFGQILALIVVTPSALSVADAMKRHGLKRLSRRRRQGLEYNSNLMHTDTV
ncbi:unnamed protein product [Cyclocybe aegerita]|uniref:Uncharacterized protein n=1 Tax=Cyclocybe aegerita TaxID=1973307 RepID=A0A8S0XM33_CYCAE|nr:unnamed protein product [Cyclocybe aegerita]